MDQAMPPDEPGQPGAAGSGDERPALVVVSRDARGSQALCRELRKRYGGDYDVLECADPAELPAVLTELRDAGTPVALVFAGVGGEDQDGIEVLASVRRLHPTALRVAAPRWGDWSTAQAITDALTMGWIDQFAMRPEGPVDEEFHRSVSEFLSEWQTRRGGGFEAVRVIGERLSPRAQELRDLFFRNRIPTGFYESDSPAGRRMLADLGLDGADLPVVMLRFGSTRSVLVNPSNLGIADAFDLMVPIPPEEVFDLAIVGAGPAGLAAAVYASSEGLKTLVIEREATGGQAGTSSLIRNYLGFAQGVTGSRLAFSAFQQAWMFGTTFRFMRAAESLRCEGDLRVLDLSDGSAVRARSVVIATGVSYRRLGIDELESLTGRGVYYGAAVSEAPAMRGRHVCVVGGGNSAGQAAVHLARWAGQVTILVRGGSLAESMSEYLVREIESAPNIDVRYRVQIVAGGGGDSLRSLELQDLDSGQRFTLAADALFVLIGSQPRTDWLAGAVARDRWGFLRTGADLVGPEPAWPLSRPPRLLETSTPGVFAAGDVRRGSVKRVASAVGEGAVAVQLVHEYLAEVAGLPAGTR